MFQPICPPAFFRCLSNLGTYMELWTTSIIESTGVACSDSVSHNQVQVLSFPVLLLTCSQDWTCWFNKGHNLKFRVGSRVQQTPESRRTYRPKRCVNNNKDNCLKTLNDKNHPRSSHTKDSKMVLDTSLLNTQHYKVWLKCKWSNPWPPLWCCS